MKNKGFSLALVFMIIFLCSSSSYGNYCEGGDDCLIGADLESEFSMSSHAARMLYDVSQSTTGKTSNRNGPSVDCPRKQGYRTCLPSRNGRGSNQNCGDYTRVC
ncbi:hypothetical protein HN51_060163 [Arachis hypogaea]|uniref:Uncharacterized protein n=1 Tax=Arachis hypogaea TaxID=3818 RepID=A0A444X8S3_ARAHY|nr:uncharacterized protein DS421_20g707430 [Arachis hypogaea]RYQ86062.1 hypothetical protein Ahy_B10g105728 [Arachis hypogaea]